MRIVAQKVEILLSREATASSLKSDQERITEGFDARGKAFRGLRNGISCQGVLVKRRLFKPIEA